MSEDTIIEVLTNGAAVGYLIYQSRVRFKALEAKFAQLVKELAVYFKETEDEHAAVRESISDVRASVESLRENNAAPGRVDDAGTVQMFPVAEGGHGVRS